MNQILWAKDGGESSEIQWWHLHFYPTIKVQSAGRYYEGVLPRLREQKIFLFTPWGPRYKHQERGTLIRSQDKEVQALRFFAGFLAELSQNMPSKSFHWLFMGADLYGTRINHLPEKVVSEYFDSFAQWLGEIIPMAKFCLWSAFDKLADLYRQRAREGFDELIDQGVLSRATETAQRMRRNSSAREYLVERLAEAMLVEGQFRPVKVSLAPSDKDHLVDWELPRIYVVPKDIRAPWL